MGATVGVALVLLAAVKLGSGGFAVHKYGSGLPVTDKFVGVPWQIVAGAFIVISFGGVNITIIGGTVAPAAS